MQSQLDPIYAVPILFLNNIKFKKILFRLKAEYTESNEQLIIVESENLKYQEDIKGKTILLPFKGLNLTFNQYY